MKIAMQKLRVNIWLVSRGAVLLLGALGANSFVPGPQSPFAGGSITLLLIFLGGGVIATIFVVGLQALNPHSATVWKCPDWYTSPFVLKQPLQFVHLAGFFFIASGVTAGLITLLRHSMGLEALLPLALGAGILIVVRYCKVVYRRKFVSH